MGFAAQQWSISRHNLAVRLYAHRAAGTQMIATRPAEALPPYQFAWARRAVLLMDIVESVRLIEEDEVGTISRWRDFVEFVKREVVEPRKGRLVKHTGDGMLIDFDDVRSAVSAALAIQQAGARRNASLPVSRQIHLRMGLELADVIVDLQDVLGHGVNLAARLMSLAGPGEIVVSQHVREGLTPSLDADIEDLGDCFVRHVAQPIRAYRIRPPGPRPEVSPLASSDDLVPTVAVVPFTPLQLEEDDHGVIGEAMVEEIIRRMSQSSDLNLISRLSTTAFSGRDGTVAEVGAHLRADYVLSGRYSSDGQRVRLSAKLEETRSGRIVWAEEFKDNVSAILNGEQDLIEALIARVFAAMTMRELQRARSQPLPTLRSYTLLMGAINLMHRLSLPDFERAQRLLQEVIDRGGRRPIPMAWLALWHVLRVQQGWSGDPRQDSYLALECTKRALDADPDCSLALAIHGLVHTSLLNRLDIALESYEGALNANPSNPLAWLLKGTLHAFRSEGKLAVEHTARARKLTPLHPFHYFYDSLSATACAAAGEYEEAVKLAERSLRSNRKHTSTWRALTVAQWRLGQQEDARQSVRELMKLQPSLTVSGWLRNSPAAPYPIGRETAEVMRLAGVPE